MKFKEIEIGKSEQIRALLTGIEERGAKAGTRYLVLSFTDGEQTVTAETKPGEMSDRLFALDCRVYNPKN